MSQDSFGGPYLAIAVFCERVLREADGVISLIRIVDRWTISGSTEEMPSAVIQTNLVVSAKSGQYRGSTNIEVTPTSPSGATLPAVSFPVLFEGDDDRGIAIGSGLGFPVKEPGTYWFEIKVSGQVLTRTPLRVIYHRTVPAAATSKG